MHFVQVQDVPHKRSAPLFSYGIALALPAFAILLVLQLGLNTFLFSTLAVVISAWRGGLWPGLLSGVLSVLGMTYFILPPANSFGAVSFEEVLRLGFFALLSILISSIMEARYRAEDALRKNQRLLTCLLDNAPMPISVSTPNGQYILVNRAWKKADMSPGYATTVRLKDEEWVFESDKLMGPLGDASAPLAKPVMTEEVLDTPDGRRYYQIYKFPAHDTSGNVEAIGTISIDITEIRKAAQSLQDQQKPQ